MRRKRINKVFIMTITIHWWYFPIILFILPFAYGTIRGSAGDYDFMIDIIIVFAVCWFLAIGLTLGKLF